MRAGDQKHTIILFEWPNNMGNQLTSRSRLTDEAELTMFKSSLEDIQSRFASLLISVRKALEANHYNTGDVRSILVGIFVGTSR